MSRQKIIFRADGNSEIGLGHLMRSLALAEMLKNDFECLFATRFLSNFIKEEILKICSDIIKLREDEENHYIEFIEKLQGHEIVVLDNYFFSTDYQKAIKDKGSKLVCIDDMFDKHYVADLIINHAPGLTTKLFSIEEYSSLLLGLDYAILRKPFLIEASKNKIALGNQNIILICFGGSDIHNITQKTLDIIVSIDTISEINVIISSSYPHIKNLESFIQEQNIDINIHQNITSEQIIKVGRRCSIAVTSASTISFEMLALGLPLIIGFYVSNQFNIYNGLVKLENVKGIGNLLSISSDILLMLKTMLAENNKQVRAIDGESGLRILKEFKMLI